MPGGITQNENGMTNVDGWLKDVSQVTLHAKTPVQWYSYPHLNSLNMDSQLLSISTSVSEPLMVSKRSQNVRMLPSEISFYTAIQKIMIAEVWKWRNSNVHFNCRSRCQGVWIWGWLVMCSAVYRNAIKLVKLFISGI